MHTFEDRTPYGFTSVKRRGPASLFTLLFLALVAVLGGCGTSSGDNDSQGPESGQTAATSTEGSSEGSTGQASSTPCDNPYYLVDPGRVRKYRLDSSVPDGDREYTLKQKPVDKDTFTEIRSFSSGTVVSVNWNCTDEGLRAAEYVNEVNMSIGSGQMETLESTGLTVPNSLEPGKEWTSVYKIRATVEAGPVKQSANGTVTLEHRLAAADEKVTVQGGVFLTSRIDTVIKMDLKIGGTSVPTKDFRSTVWISPEVGIVKQVAESGFGEEKIEFVGFE